MYDIEVLRIQNFVIFAFPKNGLVAEWLGSGLQNRVQRFKSARDLPEIPVNDDVAGIFLYP